MLSVIGSSSIIPAEPTAAFFRINLIDNWRLKLKKARDNSDEHREAAVASAICGEPQQGSTSIIRSSSSIEKLIAILQSRSSISVSIVQGSCKFVHARTNESILTSPPCGSCVFAEVAHKADLLCVKLTLWNRTFPAESRYDPMRQNAAVVPTTMYRTHYVRDVDVSSFCLLLALRLQLWYFCSFVSQPAFDLFPAVARVKAIF